MQLNIIIVGVLFPAIPLMMINFGNRYALLAGLIRNLHDTVINEKISTDDSSRFFSQIASLRHRLRLLAIVQTCSALAFIFNLSAMISLYFGIESLGSCLFFLSIILMVAAMIQFTIEIQIANSALDVHLSDLENIKNGRIIWQHQNHVVRIHAKPCHLRRTQLAKIHGNQRAWLLLIVFTLQIANDRQRIFFSNIQTLAQIIDFFTFITSNNTITER